MPIPRRQSFPVRLTFAAEDGGRSKFNVAKRKVEIDGITFDSRAEAAQYNQLQVRIRAGEIDSLQVHPEFVLVDAFTHPHQGAIKAIAYRPDFVYRDVRSGRVVVEDVKGFRTPDFDIKRKLFLQRYRDHDLVLVDANNFYRRPRCPGVRHRSPLPRR
jgi:hypothetical protein